MPTRAQHPRIVAAAEEIALDLVSMVRDEDPVVVWRRLSGLSPQTVLAVVIALAAMVDDARPLSELLDWINRAVAA